MSPLRLLLVTLLFAAACEPAEPANDDDDATTPTDDDDSVETGDGLFTQGCPEEGSSFARLLASDDEAPWGETAISAAGDVVLGNSSAAWVIAAPGDNPRTWYHYGGVPIDAVPVDGCEQAGPERFGVVGWILGQLNLLDFPQSSLRMFRGEEIEIVSDGSDGGPAIVDVHGVDDRFWLVEYELIRGAYEDGNPKPMTEPYGMDVTVRYILEPDQPVLDVQIRMTGVTVDDNFIAGSLLFPADRTLEHAFSNGSIGAGGVNLDTQVPWFAAGSSEGSFAIGVPEGTGSRTTFSGVTGFLDLELLLEPLPVSPGSTQVARMALSVGAGGTGSATAPLMDHMPTPFPDGQAGGVVVSGTVRDPDGVAVGDGYVWVEAETDGGGFELLDTFAVDTEGVFSGVLAPVGANRWRVYASGGGRDDSEVVEIDAAPMGDIELVLGRLGSLTPAIADPGGTALPARVELERADGATFVRWAHPDGTALAVPPGVYTVWVSRGYEWGIEERTITIPNDGDALLEVTLERAFETPGWASIDSHVHSEPSPDSRVLPENRMLTGAASGLDVIITTDHEAIIDLSPFVESAGLGDYIQTSLGSEVTAPLPEHTNAWPFPPRPEVPRGDHVKWYEHTLEGIWEVERERGAQIVQLNHSRVNGNCNFMCIVDWNRLTGEPAETDPTLLGLRADEALWSWDLDSMEVMNGLRSPFMDPGNPRRTGSFEDNMAMHNLGHQVTAMAVTDSHGDGPPGQPRTYVAVDDDTPGAVPEEQLVAGVQVGSAQMSAGVFATEVEIAGAGPGELALLGSTTAQLALRIEGIPAVDVSHITVLANCDEVAEFAADGPDAALKFDDGVTLELEADAHIVVLAFGANSMPRGLRNYSTDAPRLVTSPIFVDVDGNGVFDAPGGKECNWTAAFEGATR
ncbi:MAG: PHP domain-containing protein [Deltaproteobacteria bacterium]|nr:PHP domain-containing protein [Deltaproteobacteria bacterium]